MWADKKAWCAQIEDKVRLIAEEFNMEICSEGKTLTLA
jgi:hypothetical protein